MSDCGYVYFAKASGEDLIKIGYTTRPDLRIKQLQTGCPFRLGYELIVRGSPEYEKSLHQRYSHLRTGGEWFRFADDLREFVESSLDTAVKMETLILEEAMGEIFAAVGRAQDRGDDEEARTLAQAYTGLRKRQHDQWQADRGSR